MRVEPDQSEPSSCSPWDRNGCMHPSTRTPAEHDTFWQAQALECVASAKLCDQTLGALAMKYGLGTTYDPFIQNEARGGRLRTEVTSSRQL